MRYESRTAKLIQVRKVGSIILHWLCVPFPIAIQAKILPFMSESRRDARVVLSLSRISNVLPSIIRRKLQCDPETRAGAWQIINRQQIFG